MKTGSLRLLRFGLVLLTMAAPYAAGSCKSSDSTAATGDQGDPALADVIYEGGTTDEALAAMLAAVPLDWTWKGGVFDLPTDGQSLSKDKPVTFAWHQDTSGGTGGAGGAGGGATGGGGGAGGAAFLRELFGPERAAYAHGAPFNGTAFFLVFSTASDSKLLRVFTSNMTYTPSADAWAKLVGAGVPITLSIESAIFDQNLLAQDGGPYRGSQVTFTIQ